MALLKRLTPLIGLVALLTLIASAVSAQTITWWYWDPPDIMEKHYFPLVREFEEKTGIKVEAQEVGWSDMQERILVSVLGGTPPDVVTISSRWADSLAMQGIFHDLTPYVERDPDFDDFFPAAMELWQTWDGKQYGIGGDLDLPALFYNKEMFDQHGIVYPTDVDWYEWLDAAKLMTRDTDGDGAFDQYGLTLWWYVWITMIEGNGGHIITPDRSDIGLGAPEARAAIDFIKEIVEGSLDPSIADAQRLGTPHPAALFKAGRIATAPAGAWMPSLYVFDSTIGDYAFDFDVTHLPKAPNGGRVTPVEGSAMAIPATSENKEAAWEFIKFMRSADAMRQYALDGFPTRISVAREAFDRPDRKPDNSIVLIDVVQYGKPFPRGVDWWGSLYPTIMGGISAYLNGSEPSYTGMVENIRAQVVPILAELTAE